MNSEQLILEELKVIRKEVEEIKEHMIDVDTTLTLEEEKRLNESLKEHKAGKSIKLEDFEKEINK